VRRASTAIRAPPATRVSAASRARLQPHATRVTLGHAVYGEPPGVLARPGIEGYVGAYGAKGAVIFAADRINNYRDFLGYDGRYGHVRWLYQHNGGVFLPPWGKCEQLTMSVQHTMEDVNRFVRNFETFASALRDGATA